jgi:hypothetical protein
MVHRSPANSCVVVPEAPVSGPYCLPQLHSTDLEAIGPRRNGNGRIQSHLVLPSLGQSSSPVKLEIRMVTLAAKMKQLGHFLCTTGVALIFNSAPVEFRQDSVVLDVKGARQEILNDYVWIFAGGTPPNDFLRKIGVQLGDLNLTAMPGARPTSSEAAEVHLLPRQSRGID